MKVLFHVNEPDRWSRSLLNIKNLLRDVGAGKITVEVVANGSGVLPYSQGEKELLDQMTELQKQGVVFVACRNALNMHKINEKSLPPFISVVPAGITEIVRKQTEGHAYVKP